MNTFAEGAPQWCCLASRLLGWRPAEFWRATPTELIWAIQDPDPAKTIAAPSRDLIDQLLERDSHG